MHPLEAEPLVVEACIRHCPRSQNEGWAAEEAEMAKTVINRDPDDRAWGFLKKKAGVSHRGFRTHRVAAAKHPVGIFDQFLLPLAWMN